MDLNELLHAHQVEILKANASRDCGTRENHFGMIAQYASEIRALRAIAPPDRPPPVELSGDTIIYGSYAGATLPVPASDAGERAASENPDRGHSDN